FRGRRGEAAGRRPARRLSRGGRWCGGTRERCRAQLLQQRLQPGGQRLKCRRWMGRRGSRTGRGCAVSCAPRRLPRIPLCLGALWAAGTSRWLRFGNRYAANPRLRSRSG
ncbi:hypothetical protein BGX30_008899, partial [Mortierella sp. GBA39]